MTKTVKKYKHDVLTFSDAIIKWKKKQYLWTNFKRKTIGHLKERWQNILKAKQRADGVTLSAKT